MTDLTIDELLALGQLAGYRHSEVARMMLEADDEKRAARPSGKSGSET